MLCYHCCSLSLNSRLATRSHIIESENSSFASSGDDDARERLLNFSDNLISSSDIHSALRVTVPSSFNLSAHLGLGQTNAPYSGSMMRLCTLLGPGSVTLHPTKPIQIHALQLHCGLSAYRSLLMLFPPYY